MTTLLSPIRRRAPILGAIVASATVTACAWSVPADPGENARLRSRGSDASPAVDSARPPASATGSGPVLAIGGARTDDGAGAIYRTRCAQCHEPFSPRYATAGEWPGYVRKYGPRAGLFGAERERVLAWLQANAR